MFGFDDIIGQGLKIINKFVPDKELAAKLQAELSTELMKHEAEFVSYQRDIIVAEAKSESWMARNWRPIMMLMFVFIIFNNHVLAGWLQSFGFTYVVLTVPEDMWDLLKIGLGGYIVGRSAEKTMKEYKNN